MTGGGPVPGTGKRMRTGVPEIDAILREVKRQGGRIVPRGRTGHSWTVIGPRGAAGIQSSRVGPSQVRGIRSRLKHIGFDL